MAMTTFLARISLIVIASAVLAAVATATPALVEHRGPDGAPNPQASVVNEQTLLGQAPHVEGRIDIPDSKASVLIQPAGREWEYFHEVALHWLGAIVILGMIIALGIAYLAIGRIRISAGRSGRRIPRFSPFERFSHWLTAVSFVVLGLTGPNITFGKIVLFAGGWA
jgi:formate dehydrogenase subunit gamma